MAPHPLGEVRLEGTPAVLLGQESEGYRLALSTLEVFRPSVGATGTTYTMIGAVVDSTKGRDSAK